jgi:hypothetical protein
MNEHDPIGNDAREAEHLRKLGPPPHICRFCGRNDPRLLIPKPASWVRDRVPRSVLEKHHVFLEALDPDFTVLLCILCHFEVTQAYMQAGIDFGPEPNPRKRVALMLRADAVYLHQLAERHFQWAELLDNEGRQNEES